MTRRSLTPSNSRPQTPPSSSSKRTSRYATQSPPPRMNSTVSSPAKRPANPQPAPQALSAWDLEVEDEDDDDSAEEYYYNENVDEDEFGLPSITSTRREPKRRIPISKVNDPGGGVPGAVNGVTSKLSPEHSFGRARANSSDIAEERGPPSYPTAKKSEGKILRPQYKDILRGMHHFYSYILLQLKIVSDQHENRPCKHPSSHKSPSSTAEPNRKRS